MAAIEMLADEVIGTDAHNEHMLLAAKLGGTQKNRVLAFFGIKAPGRATEARLIEAKEKKKAKAKANKEAAKGRPRSPPPSGCRRNQCP